MDRSDGGVDVGYLESIERLAHDVVEAAAQEGWLAFDRDDEGGQSQSQHAVNALARKLRIVHFEGDGCIEHLSGSSAP